MHEFVFDAILVLCMLMTILLLYYIILCCINNASLTFFSKDYNSKSNTFYDHNQLFMYISYFTQVTLIF